MFTIVLLYAEKQNNKALSAKYCGTTTSSSYAWKHQMARCVPLPSAGRHHVGPGLAAGPPPTAPGSTKGEEPAPAHGWKAPRGARAGSRKGLGCRGTAMLRPAPGPPLAMAHTFCSHCCPVASAGESVAISW